MSIHPDLWPAIAGAVLGLPLLAWSGRALRRAWDRRPIWMRRALALLWGLFALAYVLNVYAWLIEPNLLVVRRVTIVSENWRGPPLTIAAIGDTHVGSAHVDVARMGGIVAAANALRPDLVVLLGDYVGDNDSWRPPSARIGQESLLGIATFAALTPRYGTIAVLGNHDVWWSRSLLSNALQEAGANALWNRHVVIARSSGRFVVAGLADVDVEPPDFAKALDGAPPVPQIVLAHEPDSFARAPLNIALMIAAHTHCGQVTIPFFGRPIVPSDFGQRYACGLVREHGAPLFVTGGVGTSQLPVRFLNPPEIALITLVAAAPARRAESRAAASASRAQAPLN